MKNPVKKLLAIAFVMGAASTASADAPRTLANGAPACGNSGGKGMSGCERAERNLTNARTELASALRGEREAVAALLTRPRVLASGAPACGNTGGKMPECTTDRADRAYDARVQRLVTAGERVREARAKIASARVAYEKYAGAIDPELAVVAMAPRPIAGEE